MAGYLESRVKFGLLNLWRKEAKRKQMEYQGDNALEYMAAPDNPQAELEYKETLERMLAALQELPQRQLLVLLSYCSLWAKIGIHCAGARDYGAGSLSIEKKSVEPFKKSIALNVYK